MTHFESGSFLGKRHADLKHFSRKVVDHDILGSVASGTINHVQSHFNRTKSLAYLCRILDSYKIRPKAPISNRVLRIRDDTIRRSLCRDGREHITSRQLFRSRLTHHIVSSLVHHTRCRVVCTGSKLRRCLAHYHLQSDIRSEGHGIR
jgi:hypothetical protein